MDVNGTINIRFDNGVLAAIVIGGNYPGNAGYLMYAFEGGKIAIDSWSDIWYESARTGRLVRPKRS